MTTTQGYLLIHRDAEGNITAPNVPYKTFAHAARGAGMALERHKLAGSAAARNFASALARRPLGTIWGHGSGYDFRILRPDFTADGVAITPGLKVITNDLKWGLVEPTQFMSEKDSFAPGGEHHDGWYLLTHEDGTLYAKFNGERLGIRHPVTKETG